MMLRRVNASLGFKKQVHTMLLVFGKEPRSVVTDVLTAWRGPNKNELCVFISLDGDEVQWVEVHSWMDNTTLHAVIRDELMGEPFTVKRYADLLREYVPKHWIRKEFTPLNEYLSVPLNPMWGIVGAVIALVLGVVSFLIIEAAFRRQSYGYGFRRRRRW
jgi:hypothetical protein